jgi:hypothetical protein
MHTAICTFQDREAAERARDRLLQAGFARHDVHLQHPDEPRRQAREPAGEDPRAWEGTDHEVAVSRETLNRVAGFFVHLFGQERTTEHHRRYSEAAGRGHYVLVVDARDEAEARRAQQLLDGAADLDVVHRQEQKPLRDWAQAAAIQDAPADPAGVHQRTAQDAGWSEARAGGGNWSERGERMEAERERALAAGETGVQRPLDLREPDRREELDPVGLRYADKDKPGR